MQCNPFHNYTTRPVKGVMTSDSSITSCEVPRRHRTTGYSCVGTECRALNDYQSFFHMVPQKTIDCNVHRNPVPDIHVSVEDQNYPQPYAQQKSAENRQSLTLRNRKAVTPRVHVYIHRPSQ